MIFCSHSSSLASTLAVGGQAVDAFWLEFEKVGKRDAFMEIFIQIPNYALTKVKDNMLPACNGTQSHFSTASVPSPWNDDDNGQENGHILDLRFDSVPK